MVQTHIRQRASRQKTPAIADVTKERLLSRQLPPHLCQRLLDHEGLQVLNRFLRAVLRGHHRVLVLEGNDVVVACGNERRDDPAPVDLTPARNPEPEAPIRPHPASRWDHPGPSDLVLLQLSVLCVAV
jgi:hypothetical protein